MRRSLIVILVCAACGGSPASTTDAGRFDAGGVAAGDGGSANDAGRVDGGSADAGTVDGGEPDAGRPDGGAPDADASIPFDGGPIDAGEADAAVPDAGLSDDAGTPDAGAPSDAGPIDGGSDAGAGPIDAGSDVDAGVVFIAPEIPDGGVLVRVCAANLTSGTLQNYDGGHGQRILRALQPDIVLIQEFNVGNNGTDVRAFVDQTFGPSYAYYRGAGLIPNGVISRYPIVNAGEWQDTLTSDREYTWAQIDVPGDTDAWAISVHLRTSTAQTRTDQATALLQAIATDVPNDTFLILGGDFNTDNRAENVLTTLAGRFITAAPWPTDNSLADGGNGNTNASRGRPYDWVVVNSALSSREYPTIVAGQVFVNGIVFDSRVFSPLASLPPVLAGDSSAQNMQHMAVMRTFVFGP